LCTTLVAAAPSLFAFRQNDHFFQSGTDCIHS
jgi:hypothetical protein